MEKSGVIVEGTVLFSLAALNAEFVIRSCCLYRELFRLMPCDASCHHVSMLHFTVLEYFFVTFMLPVDTTVCAGLIDVVFICARSSSTITYRRLFRTSSIVADRW